MLKLALMSTEKRLATILAGGALGGSLGNTIASTDKNKDKEEMRRILYTALGIGLGAYGGNLMSTKVASIHTAFDSELQKLGGVPYNELSTKDKARRVATLIGLSALGAGLGAGVGYGITRVMPKNLRSTRLGRGVALGLGVATPALGGTLLRAKRRFIETGE